MSNFRANCGASLPSPVSFCAHCGQPVAKAAAVALPHAPPSAGQQGAQQWRTAPAPPPQPSAQQRGTGLGKILLVAFVLIAVILAGIAGAGYYAVRRVKQKVQQVQAEYREDQPAVVGRAALGGRSACDLLGKSDLRRITGVAISDSVPTESGSELTCEYFTVSPETRSVRPAVKVEEIKDAQQALDAVHAALSQAVKEAPVLRVTIHLANAKAMMLASRVAAHVTAKDSRIDHLGDEAYIDGTGTILAARKGTRVVMLSMPLLPRSRDNGPLIARKLLDQI